MANQKRTTKDPHSTYFVYVSTCWEDRQKRESYTVWLEGREFPAARYFYNERYGTQLSKDIWLQPMCGNVRCVNPEHQAPTTKKLLTQKRFREAKDSLDPKDVERARRLLKRKQTVKEIALRMGWTYQQALAAVAPDLPNPFKSVG